MERQSAGHTSQKGKKMKTYFKATELDKAYQKRQIEEKQKEYDHYLAETVLLRQEGRDKYDDEVVYARNRVKWLSREISSLEWKLSKGIK
jgi:hypothetical protein